MNPVSGPRLLRSLSGARKTDGLLTLQTRERRSAWREAIQAQDAQGLKGLSRRVSLTEQWEIVAGCASVWGWNQVLSWGNVPNIAVFDGFVDALNTAEDAAHRERLWAVWPTMLDHACAEPESWLKYLLHSLGQVEVWSQGEAQRLGLVRLLPGHDWQAPFEVWDGGRDDPSLTPLQYAWFKGNPGLCRVFLEGGADGSAVSPESWWPGWSLARCFEGQCLGAEPRLMAGPDKESLRSLTSIGSTWASQLAQAPWIELMEHQRNLARNRTLEQGLPAPAPSRLKKGLRF